MVSLIAKPLKSYKSAHDQQTHHRWPLTDNRRGCSTETPQRSTLPRCLTRLARLEPSVLPFRLLPCSGRSAWSFPTSQEVGRKSHSEAVRAADRLRVLLTLNRVSPAFSASPLFERQRNAASQIAGELGCHAIGSS